MPVYIQSLSPIQCNSIVKVKLVQIPSAGQPLHINCVVRNPSDKPCVFSMVGTLGSIQSTPEKFLVPAHSQTSKEIEIAPASNGLLRLDTVLSGGINQRSIIQREIRLKTIVTLKEYEQKTFAINKMDQVCIGAQTVDDQNRVLTSCKWKGLDDLSASILLKREKKQLVFEIKVTDDKLILATENRSIYEGDAVELFVDLKHSGQTGREHINQIVCSPNGRLWLSPDNELVGLNIKANRTEKGYLVVGSFPVDFLKISQIGFDIAVNDADDMSGRKVQMVWVGNQDNFNKSGQYAQLRFSQ